MKHLFFRAGLAASLVFGLAPNAFAGFNVLMMKQRPCLNTPWGTMKHGASVTAYSSAAPAGTCASVAENRVCANGSLSGSFTNASCAIGACAGGTDPGVGGGCHSCHAGTVRGQGALSDAHSNGFQKTPVPAGIRWLQSLSPNR